MIGNAHWEGLKVGHQPRCDVRGLLFLFVSVAFWAINKYIDVHRMIFYFKYFDCGILWVFQFYSHNHVSPTLWFQSGSQEISDWDPKVIAARKWVLRWCRSDRIKKRINKLNQVAQSGSFVFSHGPLWARRTFRPLADLLMAMGQANSHRFLHNIVYC